ncbi:hypothetical protein GCM10009799_43530 [Nocardiopsis rhodophaea]|uniref:DUF397 domain-containing protein n=1 Tax=Nocardiopsis rhodophaea TaxID=280238 RepID=A0ABN2TIH5_9ACTN
MSTNPDRCLYPASQWRKSSYSGPNGCVEINDLSYGTAVRDSMNPGLGHLSFTSGEWSAFVQAVKDDEVGR